MIVVAKCRLHGTQSDSTTAGRTDSGRHVRTIETDAATSQFVNVGSGHGLITVASHPGIHVFGKDPHDIRAVRVRVRPGL